MSEERSRREFTAMVEQPGPGLDLGHACLLVAQHEYPAMAVDEYLARMAAMGEELRGRTAGAAPHDAAFLLTQYLFEEQGFRGNQDEYYDPRNSFLNEVLDRRTGIPITLSTLCIEVGRRAGLVVEGVGLPGHFVVRVGGGDGVLLDPFHGGAHLSADDCQRRLDRIFAGRVKLEPQMLAAWDGRSILARVLRNLKGIYVKDGDWGRALWVAGLLVDLLPEAPEELRDRGLLHAAMDCYRLAASDLERYVALLPHAPDAAELTERALQLRTRASRLN
jgi:regulator of sirC expression with transglutaminase-like and TPR domain